jgi:Beta-lactamase enzyme family
MRPGSFGRKHSRAASVLVAAVGVSSLLVLGGGPEPEGDAGAVAFAPPPVVGGTSVPAPAPTTPQADPLSAPVGSPTPAATTPAPTRAADPLTVAAQRAGRITASTEWASFTLLDRVGKRVVGDSRTAQLTNTESTVKTWLAADLLHQRGGDLTAYERARMTSMIRLSDDNAAEVIWRWMGSDASIRRMIKVCGLQDSRVYPEWWSLTQISSRDLARLGVCILPGKGQYLSASESAQLFALMRSVDESNAFGIQQAYPAGKGVRIAVKNGWTEHGGTGLWNVNCLGIWGKDNRYVLAVTTRYPLEKGLDYGAGVCRTVTATLFP